LRIKFVDVLVGYLVGVSRKINLTIEIWIIKIKI